MPTPLSSLLPLTSLATIISLVSQRKHLLMALLSLEAFALTLVPLYPLSLSLTNNPDITSMMIFLTFSAAEASLGLACLTTIIRLKGSDMISTLSPNKC